MLGRRLLKRLTRLGLAMYATVWSMSFTVCAYDNPIADMAVGGQMALLSQAEATLISEDYEPGDFGISSDEVIAADAEAKEEASDPVVEDADISDALISENGDETEDVESSEEVVEDDVLSEDAEDASLEDSEDDLSKEALTNETEKIKESKLLSDEEKGIYFVNSTMTINWPSYHKFAIQGKNLGNLAVENITYSIEGLDDDKLKNITLNKLDNGYAGLSFTWDWESFPPTEFYLVADYIDESGVYNATCKIVVFQPNYSFWFEAYDGTDYYENWEMYMEIHKFNISRNLNFHVWSESGAAAERFSWELYDVTNDKVLDPTNTSYVCLIDDLQNNNRKKTVSFGPDFDISTVIEVRAIYNNSYTDADGNNITGSAVTTCRIFPEYYLPVDAININKNDTTALLINESIAMLAKGVNNGNLTELDPRYLSYWFALTNDTDAELYQSFNGASITKGYYNEWHYLRFNDYYFDYGKGDEFYVVARYNKTEPVLYDSFKVKVATPANQLNIRRWGSDISGREIEMLSSDEHGFSLNAVEGGKAIDYSQLEWKYYEINGENVTEVDPHARGIRPRYEITEDGTERKDRLELTFTPVFEPGKFKVVAEYKNQFTDLDGNNISANNLSAYFTVDVKKGYAFDVKAIRFEQEVMPVQSYLNTTITIADAIAGNETTNRTVGVDELDTSKFRWGFAYPGSNDFVTISGASCTRYNNNCLVTFGEIDDDFEMDLLVKYYNREEPPYNYFNSSGSPAIGRIHLVNRRDIPPVEAHLSETSVKVQIYNGKNLVPVTIRTENVNESKYLKYRIMSVALTDEELDKYATVSVAEDQKSINIKARSEVLNMSSKELSAFMKKKFTTGIIITANVYGNVETLTPSEELTVTFAGAKISAKDLKVDGTLEFDSYYARMQRYQIPFTGPKVKEVVPVDPGSFEKQGFVVENSTYIRCNNNIPNTKTGSFKVYAVLDDSEINNLPEGHKVVVTVKYRITNSAPKLTLKKTSVLLNPSTRDAEQVEYTINGTYDDRTSIRYILTDSKNENATGQLDIRFGYNQLNDRTVTIYTNNKTQPGQTYKLSVLPYNRYNGRDGAAKVITVKTVAQKSLSKVSFSIKATGGLDVHVPTKILYLSYSGKNLDLYGKEHADFSVTLKNGTDVTNKFELYDYPHNCTSWLLQKVSGEGEFPLIGQNLDGQTVTVKVGFNTTEGMIYASCNTKIASTKFTPKLGVTKISINPDYIYNYSYIAIPVTNQYSDYYNYSITTDDGKGGSVPFEGVAQSDYDKAIIYLRPTTNDISSLAGKSFNVRITPVVPDGKAGTGVCKITVLNPKKSTASFTAKAKGSIDSV